MVQTMALAYAVCWIVSSAVVYVAARRLCDPGNPAAHRVALSAAAGSLWPLLLIGAVEFSSVAACSSAAAHLKHDEPDLISAGVVPIR